MQSMRPHLNHFTVAIGEKPLISTLHDSHAANALRQAATLVSIRRNHFEVTQMNTAFLRNAWYVAAWSKEVQERPMSRTLLGQSVLLMRLSDGSVAALGNRCPHRFAPLDHGKQIGDTIQCGYHGLRFDRTGVCIQAPGCDRPPRNARVPTYAVAERHRIIWIWGGDAANADLSLIPDLSPLDDPNRATLTDNYLQNAADYLLTLDNLMDLSHVEFLHPTTLGAAGMSGGTLTVKELPRGVEANRWMPGIEAPPFMGKAMGMSGIVDHWLDMTWLAGSNLILRAGMTKAGAPREAGHEGIAYHLITPETERSSHYFYGLSSDFGMGDPVAQEAGRAAVMRVFIEEDKPMIEACERTMAGADFWSLKPILIPSDAGAIRMRRVLQRLIDEEQTATQALASA